VEEEIRQSQQFTDRFAGMQQRIDNGYDPISVDEYLDLESGYQSTMRAMGLPQSFYDDPTDYTNFISNDVSVTELEQRVSQGFIAAQQAPPEVRRALEEFYNIPNSEGALAAYYLDPDRALPAIERQFEAAMVSGAAERASFSGLTQEQAERLGDLDISSAQAQQGFSQLGQQSELLSSNLGSGETFSTQEKLAGVFEGDANVLDRIRRQREGRTAEFDGQSSGVSVTGVTGLKGIGGR